MSRPAEHAEQPAALLRPLTEADLPQIVRWEPVLFGSQAWSAASWAEELVGEGRTYLAAEAGGALVGYAGLWFDGDDAQVMTVGTVPDWQGRGIGRALLRALVEVAVGLGAASVLLEVRVDNAPAVHLYESEGFTRLGRRRRYYQPEGADAWTMRRRLTGVRG